MPPQFSSPLRWFVLALFFSLLFVPTPQVSQASPGQIGGSTAVKAPQDICILNQQNNHVYLPLLTREGTPPTAAPMLRQLQYQVGQTYVYDYRMQSETVMNSVNSEGVNEGVPSYTLLTGLAEVSITGFENGDTFVGELALQGITLCQKSGDLPLQFVDDPNTVAAIETPVLFKQRVDGTILEVQIAEFINPVMANYAKGVLNSLQGVLAQGNAYTIAESGVQGLYEADYTASLQPNGLALTKSLNQDSFTEFYYQGDAPAMLFGTYLSLLLDREHGVYSHVRFKETADILPDNQEMGEEPPDDLEGTAFWGHTISDGTLKLTEVVPTQDQKRPHIAYQTGRIGVVFDEMAPMTGGLDPDELDLDAEFDALEADPNNPALFTRMRFLINADRESETGLVQSNLIGRLNTNLNHPDIAQTYMNLLTFDGSEGAQIALANLADPVGIPVPAEISQLALHNIALLKEPLPISYNTLSNVMNSGTATQAQMDTAAKALGAVSAALSQSNPAVAQNLANTLLLQLANAPTDAEKEVALLALGNTKMPNLLGTMQPYLGHSNTKIRAAAIWGLRNDPSEEAENLLIDMLAPIFSLDPEPWLDDPYDIPMAVMTLKNRPGKPSNNINQTLAAYDAIQPKPKGGVFIYHWNKDVGGPNVGGSLPGEFLWKSPPHATRLEVFARQNVDYRFNVPKLNIYKSGNVALATARLAPKQDNPLIQRFEYDLILFGNTLSDIEFDVACGGSGGSNISKGTHTFLDYQFVYPIWAGLSVGVDVAASVNYSIDYSYAWNVCNLLDMSGDLDVTAKANVHATARGFAQVVLLRGGVALDVDIIRVTAKGELDAVYNPTDNFKVCLNVPVNVTALDLALSLFVEGRGIKKWHTLYKETIWNYTVAATSFKIIDNQCWQAQ
jgi:hypothetical protein